MYRIHDRVKLTPPCLCTRNQDKSPQKYCTLDMFDRFVCALLRFCAREFPEKSDTKFYLVIHFLVSEFSVVHVEAYGLLIIFYNSICNTRIIQIQLESSPVQGLYKLLVVN